MRRREVAEESGDGWKGAFADFCMSMMTLFMVCGLLPSRSGATWKISLYFSDPGIFDSVNSRYMSKDTSNGLIVDHKNRGPGGNGAPGP